MMSASSAGYSQGQTQPYVNTFGPRMYKAIYGNDLGDDEIYREAAPAQAFVGNITAYDITWLSHVRMWCQPIILTSEGYTILFGSEPQESPAVLSISDMVSEIRRIFGLTAAQVAELVGVSRPALYKHINNEPPKDLSPYLRLYNLAMRVEKETGGSIGEGLKSVLVNGKTFLRHLYDKEESADSLVAMARQVAEKLRSREPSASRSLTEQRLSSRVISRSG